MVFTAYSGDSYIIDSFSNNIIDFVESPSEALSSTRSEWGWSKGEVWGNRRRRENEN